MGASKGAPVPMIPLILIPLLAACSPAFPEASPVQRVGNVWYPVCVFNCNVVMESADAKGGDASTGDVSQSRSRKTSGSIIP